MYAVSDAYKIAVADSHRKSKMRAVLKIDETIINLDDSDIIKDSVYVTNQCTNGSEYEYGCVYAAECGITIKSAVNRYKLYDAEISLFWSLWTGEAWEEIPLGVFYISEPNRVNDKINIKALDGMTKLDVNVKEDTQGTLVELMPYIAKKCGVELAQTDAELETFINSHTQYSVYADKVGTYRDLLSYLCMLSACFAVFDRAGKLKLVPYSKEQAVELTRKQRFTNATFSDYTTKFIGVKVRFIANENYATYEAGEAGNGLILDMGDNPILRGLPETKHRVLDAVYEVLKYVSYTPCEIDTLGNPALDLGDLIANSGVGKDNKTYYSPITYYSWSYRGKHKIRAVGGNPKLSGVKNKEGKQIDSLESSIESKSIVIKNYSNADSLVFNSSAVEIAALNYATTEATKAVFLMTVRVNVSLDGLLVVKFYLDGKEDTERVYKQYLERGEHIVSIADIYMSGANDRHMISIMAHMEYFESDKRKQAADVQTHKNFLDAIKTTGATVDNNIVVFPAYNVAEIDKTVATATISAGGVKAILYGQGLAGEGSWDGTLNLTDELANLVFGTSLDVGSLTDTMSCTTQIPTPIGYSSDVGTMAFSGTLAFGGITEDIFFGETIVDYVFSTASADKYTFDKYINTVNDVFSLKQIYTYESVGETIDEGSMCSIAIDYTGIDVESVVVRNE